MIFHSDTMVLASQFQATDDQNSQATSMFTNARYTRPARAARPTARQFHGQMSHCISTKLQPDAAAAPDLSEARALLDLATTSTNLLVKKTLLRKADRVRESSRDAPQIQMAMEKVGKKERRARKAASHKWKSQASFLADDEIEEAIYEARGYSDDDEREECERSFL